MGSINDEARRLPDGTLGPVPIESRLWTRVHIVGDCWEFTGSRTADGYGTVRVDGRMEKAHRAAFRLATGEIPADQVVMHSCDNPPCINPAHLSVGTVGDNNRDRQTKGRTQGLVIGAGGAIQRAKTRCPQGHPYAGDNVRYRLSGARRCAECYRLKARARRAAAKGN